MDVAPCKILYSTILPESFSGRKELPGQVGIDRLQRWFSSMGSPTSLRKAGIPEDDIDTIAETVSILATLWGLIDYTKEVIAEILHLCKA
jgi:alcohol dehydrogenase YqhD (iron-dependent ADH family)